MKNGFKCVQQHTQQAKLCIPGSLSGYPYGTTDSEVCNTWFACVRIQTCVDSAFMAHGPSLQSPARGDWILYHDYKIRCLL